MKDFLETAMLNKTGIWLGRAEIVNQQDKFIREATLNLNNRANIANLLGVQADSKLINGIFAEAAEHSFPYSVQVNFKSVINLKEIRVVDKNLERSYGVISRNTLDKVHQFDMSKKGMAFWFYLEFDKKFNFTGRHEIYISLICITEENKKGDDDYLLYNSNFYFLIKISKELVDRCLEDPELFSELKRIFPIG